GIRDYKVTGVQTCALPIYLFARAWRHPVDKQVDADMDAGAHAIGGAELGHPDEHVDAEFLRPRDIEGGKPQINLLENCGQHGHEIGRASCREGVESEGGEG